MWAFISASYFNRLSIKLILLFSGLNEPLQHPNRNLLSVVLRETLQVQKNNIGFHSASHQRNQKIKKWRVVDVFRNVLQRLLHLWQITEKTNKIRSIRSIRFCFAFRAQQMLSLCTRSLQSYFVLVLELSQVVLSVTIVKLTKKDRDRIGINFQQVLQQPPEWDPGRWKGGSLKNQGEPYAKKLARFPRPASWNSYSNIYYKSSELDVNPQSVNKEELQRGAFNRRPNNLLENGSSCFSLSNSKKFSRHLVMLFLIYDENF